MIISSKTMQQNKYNLSTLLEMNETSFGNKMEHDNW